MSLISISAPGYDTRTASGVNNFFNDTYPLAKLDTSITTSFQTISILFNTEPTDPTSSTTSTEELIYSFPHGYSYVPSTWMMWQSPSPTSLVIPGAGLSTTQYNAFGDDTRTGGYSDPFASPLSTSQALGISYYSPDGVIAETAGHAFFTTVIDTNNVYVYLIKTIDLVVGPSTVFPVHVQGRSYNMRVYTFVDDIGI